MLGGLLMLSCLLYWPDSFSHGRHRHKYEDYYYYSTYNGSQVTWMMMPDDNGLVVSAVVAGLIPNQSVSNDEVEFLLWTRENRLNPDKLKFKENSEFKFKHYDPEKKTIILIHGFSDSIKDPAYFLTLSEAFLDNDDYNVVGIDWLKLSTIPWYGQAVKNSYFVGCLAAKAIAALRALAKTKPNEFRIVAYNLGTLVAGVAGSEIKGRKIDRIIGLDPPYILASKLPENKKLDSKDADVVEVIHTSGDYIGINEPIGHRDFYPNGGKWPQPGCIYDIADRCSPRRSILYYAESVIQKGGCYGLKCNSYQEFREGKCNNKEGILLWNDAPADRISGKFYFHTNSEEPFWPLDNN